VRFRSVLVFAFLLLATPAFADFNEGVEAYKRGDYKAALAEFKPLAEAGDARSQTNLGLMYSKGYGVSQDDAEAVKWYRLAADQGQPVAQNNLGAMYVNGDGGPKDIILGMVWLMIAAENGHKPAADAVAATAQDMSPKEVDVAKRLLVVWKERLALAQKR
jgi:TPR repeat protein